MSTGKLASALALAAIGLLPVSAFADPMYKIAYDEVHPYLHYTLGNSQYAHIKNENMCSYIGLEFALAADYKLGLWANPQLSPQKAYEKLINNSMFNGEMLKGKPGEKYVFIVPHSLTKQIVNLVYFDKRFSSVDSESFNEFQYYCQEPHERWYKLPNNSWQPVR